MKRINAFSQPLRVLLLAIIVTIVICVSFGWLYSKIRFTQDRVNHSHQIINQIADIQESFIESTAVNRVYLVSGTPGLVSQYEEVARKTSDLIEKLNILTAKDVEQNSRLNAAKKLIKERLDFGTDTIKLRQSGNIEAVKNLVGSGYGTGRTSTIKFILTEMRTSEEETLQKRLVNISQLLATTIFCAVTLLVGFFIVTVCSVWKKDVSRSLEKEADRFFASANDLLCIADFNGYFTRVNPAWILTTGYSEEELLSRPYFDLVHPDDRANTTKESIDISQGLNTNNFENRYICKDGSIKWLLWHSYTDSRENCIYAIAKDITEQKEATSQLQKTHDELQYAHKNMLLDLEMAKEVQQILLTQRSPALTYKWKDQHVTIQMAHRYYLSEHLGGDLSCFLPISETKCGVLVCDVMGHGVRSALLSTVLRIMAEDQSRLPHTAAQFLTRINKEFTHLVSLSEDILFATAMYIIVDVEAMTLTISNAGHVSPLSLFRKSGKVSELPYKNCDPGPALGVFDKALYKESVYPIDNDQFIMLFTDGLIEVENPHGEALEVDMLKDTVEKYADLSGNEIFDNLIKEIRSFTGSQRFADDVCLVGIDISVR